MGSLRTVYALRWLALLSLNPLCHSNLLWNLRGEILDIVVTLKAEYSKGGVVGLVYQFRNTEHE